ncbi:MAG: HIT domain-containing protein [Hyphomicrobiales bacterium]|nr:HIT domain-containing protein [Hyphomicrobiales bacterium]MDE2017309.1 HIT domain-containing protein [Hyphomicrobiales bacterium]
MSAYDPANIFARILRGEIPCHRIYEDEAALAFMDVMPRVEGHALVIPKAASRNLLDAQASTVAAMAPALTKVARAVKAATGAQGLLIEQYNEPAAGQSVYHLHFHVLPRHEGQALKPHAAEMADPAGLAAMARRIAVAIK